MQLLDLAPRNILEHRVLDERSQARMSWSKEIALSNISAKQGEARVGPRLEQGLERLEASRRTVGGCDAAHVPTLDGLVE